MYAGTTLTNKSGGILGAHQKIDRVSRINLSKLEVDPEGFPAIKEILHFEGKNGPDGIKRKSPSVNEPWHFLNPFDDKDTTLIDLIAKHHKLLVEALRGNMSEKAAFEAAWLAHSIVDGLTPAHHYPYEEKLSELRGGEGNETRSTIKDKLIIPGINRRDKVKNNWKMWGFKGLISTHGMFELGVASIMAPVAFSDSTPTEQDIEEFGKVGVGKYFQKTAREIAVQDMYTRYYQRGWTTKLTLDVRNKLVPSIIKTVTLAWHSAYLEANKPSKKYTTKKTTKKKA
ncbi:hypothetical protein KC946_02250 [Candidatus Saccharibacteria bacterium]|nr:hypothetical protein [Candidatus Saccharibacteria bacterium]